MSALRNFAPYEAGGFTNIQVTGTEIPRAQTEAFPVQAQACLMQESNQRYFGVNKLSVVTYHHHHPIFVHS